MPSSKKTRNKNKPPKSKVQVGQVDLERLFDTLCEYVRTNPENRKLLTERAFREHVTKGRGMFVVDFFSPERLETDIPTLFSSLEWWNHERCVSEPMPEYLPNDKVHYSRHLHDYLHIHVHTSEFIIAMVFRHVRGEWGTSMNTFAHYRGPNAVYGKDPNWPADFNPYEVDKVGETVTFKGTKCGAEDCDAMKVKRVVAVACDECGATPESCLCPKRTERLNTLGDKKLLQCGGCRKIAYCSRECQVRDWKARHKHICDGRKKKKELK